MVTLTKQAIRNLMRKQRASLAHRQVTDLSTDAVRLFCRTRVFFRSQNIAIYYPFQNEIDPLSIANRAAKLGKNVYFPVIRRSGKLMFAPHAPRFKINRYQIPEPDVAPRFLQPVSRMDVILLPLLAFDDLGIRLGYGGGYYDRTLAFLHHRQNWQRPALVGFAYSFQQYHRLPHEPWDIKLSMVVTNNGVIKISGK